MNQPSLPEHIESKNYICVCIPVFCELNNGNLRRLLESFLNQTVNEYCLIFLINNRPENCINNDQIFTENQKTVMALSNTDGASDIYQLVAAIKAKGAEIIVVDQTQGIEREMGLIRNIGLKTANEFFQQSFTASSKRVISHLDCDTVVERKYIEKLCEVFEDQNVETAFLSMDTICTVGVPDLFRTTYYDMWDRTISAFINSFRGKEVLAGGCQISARESSYEKVAGFRSLEYSEDFDISKRLSTLTRSVWAEIWVHTADRARAESYDGGMRLSTLGMNIKSGPADSGYGGVALYKTISAKFMNFLIGKQVLMTSNEDSLKASSNLSAYEIASHLEELIEQVVPKTEFIECKNLIKKSHDFHKSRFEKNKAFIEDSVKHIFTGYPLEYSPSYKEFLSLNMWFINALENLPNQFSNASESLNHLSEDFPDWLGQFEETPWLYPTAKLMGLVTFLRDAQSSPHKYPVSSKIFKRSGENGTLFK